MDEQTNSLFEIPEQPRSRTSDIIASLAERAKESDVTLRNLISRLGDRTYGMIMILCAIFSILPLISIISGLVTAALGAQMMIGISRPWLPRMILDYQLPSQKVQQILSESVPKVRAIERYIKPRWQFSEAPIVDRINGFLVMILGFTIMLPIPFTNIFPALIVILMGLGIMERDGLVQVSAALLGIVIISFIYSFI